MQNGLILTQHADPASYITKDSKRHTVVRFSKRRENVSVEHVLMQAFIVSTTCCRTPCSPLKTLITWPKVCSYRFTRVYQSHALPRIGIDEQEKECFSNKWDVYGKKHGQNPSENRDANGNYSIQVIAKVIRRSVIVSTQNLSVGVTNGKNEH